jgi:UrcA family protein
MNHLIACAMAVVAIAGSAPAFAGQAEATRPAGVRVDLDGLDLRTVEGRAGARERVEAAVALYCTVDDLSSRARAAEGQCKAAVTPKVLAQVERMAADPAMSKALRGG